MRFDSWLVEVSATPSYLLLVFLLLLAALHAVLVWWKPLDDVAWKKVDYIWLGAAALGLLAASAQADRFMSKALLENVEIPQTTRTYGYLRSHLASAGNPESFLCITRTRSPLSPDDFDRIVQAQQELCAWSREVSSKMHPDVRLPFPTLEETGYIPVSEKHAKYESWYIAETRKLAEAYGLQRERYIERRKSSERSISEELLSIIGPLVLAFALALRITKVSGELKNAKKKVA